MLKIGEFAKICNVSTSTLRFYDTEGLLCPDYVDEESGYRYYSEEKVQTFHKIETLKEMNFSLDEIKQVLASEGGENLYIKKIGELAEKISDMKWQIRRMRKICGFKGEPFFSYAEMKGRFINDSEAIGHWVLCGELTDEDTFETKKPEPPIFPELYFMPGGQNWWIFFWSRGVLYRYIGKNMYYSENYRIFELDGEKYMKLEWTDIECDEDGNVLPEGKRSLLYKQKEARAFTFAEAIIYKDDVDLPFVPDNEVLGEWECFDFVERPEDFDPKHPEENLYCESISFAADGTYTRVYKKCDPYGGHYTKGVIMDKKMCTAEKYIIRKIGKEKYLIAEHKSGDYSYGGEVRAYYVFKKKGK